MTSPLRAVLEALEQGAPTVAAVRARTGLNIAVVNAAVDHLIRTGRVGASPLTTCPGSCGSCPVAAAPGGCGPDAVTGPDTSTGAGRILLALWVTPQVTGRDPILHNGSRRGQADA